MKSYVFGRFMVEGRLQRLVHDGRIVPLKPKAYDLLCVLLARRDQVLGKDELLDWLWPRQDVGEANLTQTVYELRQALGESASEPRWIETVPRRGYRFKGSVLERTQKPAPGAPDSLAVLPFRPLTSQPEIRELGLGIADAIILSLSATRRAVVRPLSAVLPYANSEQDTLAIGRLLDVDTVLEGTVQQFGNRLRVSSRLLTCPAGEDLWSSTRETGVDDLFATQDVIARQAADAVAGHLEYERPGPPLSPHGANHDVHALYLKARFCWQRWVPEASRQALEYLDEAVALDPAHAPSHAWRAAAWSTLGILGAEAPRIVAENARAAARQAVELDPSLSEGHEMLGAVQLFFDW
ncbi:MAG: winged helix-turn-helix domain-containing protein, partial [Gammaproteobacteria bacterium]|nr:winged helix-turn-helix domain-containing protein [Gammaproteobacteria bacterium]